MLKSKKSLLFSLLLSALVFAAAVPAFAQDVCGDSEQPARAALQNTFREKYAAKDWQTRQLAVDAAKSFLEKYGSCEGEADVVKYYKDNVPGMEKAIQAQKDREVLAAKEVDIKAKMAKFDTALKAKDWNTVYSVGEDLIKTDPDRFRVLEPVLGTIGYDEANKKPPVTTWNEQTTKWAKATIADIEAGKTFTPGYGLNPFAYKSKEHALGWMNYNIAFFTFSDKKDAKTASQYYYKALKAFSDFEKDPILFRNIALFYSDMLNAKITELKTIETNHEALLKKDPPATDEEKQASLNNVLQKRGEVKAISERALDAYSRAYKIANADPKLKTDAAGYYDEMKKFYQNRFEKTDGLDAWVTANTAKPIVDPSTPIVPVVEAAPAVAPAATTPAAAATPAVTTPAKPAATAPAKPAATKPATTPAKPAGNKPGNK